MRIGIATDHGGFSLKQEMFVRLRAAGHEVIDFGAHNLHPDDDYPDFVIPLSQSVAAGEVERGIAVCGSGVGVSICANKIPGVRAGLVLDHFSARQGVEDDHMNMICFEEPDKQRLYFCLGLINYNAKRDLGAAHRDFTSFSHDC
jgi:ribose 5-phosphate isomerase B